MTLGVLCIVAFFFFCCMDYSSNYRYDVYCEFRLCVTTTLSAAASKAVGLSPYPYKFLERTVTMMTKTEILKFRVTPEEKEIITHKALSSYRLVSQYLRDCALEKQITVITVQIMLPKSSGASVIM